MSKRTTKDERELLYRVEKLKEAIHLLLDAADWKAGACGPAEMVGAVLPVEVLTRVRKILRGEYD